MWGAIRRRNCSYCGATTASEGSKSKYFLVQWKARIVQGQRRAVAATFCLQCDIHKRAPMHTAHSCRTDDHHESQDKIHQAKEILIYKTVLESECIMQETIALCWAQALSALDFFGMQVIRRGGLEDDISPPAVSVNKGTCTVSKLWSWSKSFCFPIVYYFCYFHFCFFLPPCYSCYFSV